VKQTLDFEWIVEGEMRPIPTVASEARTPFLGFSLRAISLRALKSRVVKVASMLTAMAQEIGWPSKLRLLSLNGIEYFLISSYFWRTSRALAGNCVFTR